MRRRRSARRALWAGLVAVALVTAGCSSNSSPHSAANPTQVGSGVTYSAADGSTQVRAVVSSMPLPVGEHALRLSQTYDLQPSGKLPKPVSVTLPLDADVPAGGTVLIETAETATGVAGLLSGTVTSDGKHVTFTTTHFSLFGAVWFDVTDAAGQFTRALLDGLDHGATATAKPPSCSGEALARGDGFSIASNSGSTIYWCLGFGSNGRRVLKVVNNRRYPLEISHIGMSVLDAGELQLDNLAQLSRSVSGRYTIVLPRGAAVFDAELVRGTAARVHTQLDGLGSSLYALQTGVQSLIDIMTRFGLGSGLKAVEVTDVLLSSDSCLSNLDKGPIGVLSNCFSPSEIVAAFGLKALLVAEIMAVGSVVEFFHSEFNAITDTLNSRDSYAIVLHHEQVNSQKPIIGVPGGTGGTTGGGTTGGTTGGGTTGGTTGGGTTGGTTSGGTTGGTTSGTQHPVFNVMNTSETPPDGVWFRNSAHTGDTDRATGHGVYSGDQVQLSCYTFGDSVGPYNDSLWYYVSNVTRPTVSSNGTSNIGFLNAHYVNDGKNANVVDAGVPAC
jgi:hypothetical protein